MLISFGAVIGKVTISQLVGMALIEVVAQSANQHIGHQYLKVEKHLKIN